jgi:rhodanese-related sulfurtransferase
MTRSLIRILALPLFALALAGLWTLRPPAEEFARDKTFPRVTWSETEPHVASGAWLLVDARDEEYFAAQHIPGAISLPAHAYPELLQFFAEDYGTEKTVVVYCGTEDCDVSNELAIRLRDEAGCSDLRILDGGFLAWQRSTR